MVSEILFYLRWHITLRSVDSYVSWDVKRDKICTNYCHHKIADLTSTTRRLTLYSEKLIFFQAVPFSSNFKSKQQSQIFFSSNLFYDWFKNQISNSILSKKKIRLEIKWSKKKKNLILWNFVETWNFLTLSFKIESVIIHIFD